jgi:hypothetical protein
MVAVVSNIGVVLIVATVYIGAAIVVFTASASLFK